MSVVHSGFNPLVTAQLHVRTVKGRELKAVFTPRVGTTLRVSASLNLAPGQLTCFPLVLTLTCRSCFKSLYLDSVIWFSLLSYEIEQIQ